MNNKNNIVDLELDIDELTEFEVVEPTVVISDTNPDNFDEVLQLSQYDGGALSTNNNDFIIAKYDEVKVEEIDRYQKLNAKKLVDKITKFVCSFNDVELSEEHKEYIKHVGELQLSNLQDLLTLTVINKQMIANIVERVNATQAEDYSIINSYNNLINQHIKLVKEVSTHYKSIPATIKKMRAEVITNQEIIGSIEGDEVITEDYGETQFNSSKALLKTILQNKDNNKP